MHAITLRMGRVAVAIVGALVLGGCVSTEAYYGLESQYLAERDKRQKLSDEVNLLRDESRASSLAAERAAERVRELEEKLRLADHENASMNERLKESQMHLSSTRLEYEQLRNQHRGISSKLEKVMEEMSEQEGVDYSKAQGKLALSNELLFESGRSALSASGRATLQRFAEALRESDEHVHVAGHTDSDPVSRTSAIWPHGNWSLSGARALEVLAVLQASGVPGERMYFAGYGPHRPVATNETEAGKSLNRRVEIYVLAAQDMGEAR